MVGSDGLLSCLTALRKNRGQLPVQFFPINLEICWVYQMKRFKIEALDDS